MNAHMTDQERAAIISKAFTLIAQNKNVEFITSNDWIELEPKVWLDLFKYVKAIREAPKTITATVTIPKPLKEWPADESMVWIDHGYTVQPVNANRYQNRVYEQELLNGIVFETREQAEQSQQAIRKFRTGHST